MVMELDGDVLEKAAQEALEYFDNETSIYPLQIHPSSLHTIGLKPNTIMDEEVCTLSGIHFVFTEELLKLSGNYQASIIISTDNHIDIVSTEIGSWCKLLINQYPLHMLECIDIPFLYRDDGFIRFEELATNFLTKQILHQSLPTIPELYHWLMGTPWTALFSLYDFLRIDKIARTGHFVHELDAVLEDPIIDRQMWDDLVKARKEERELTRLERSKIREYAEELIPTIRDNIDNSQLPDEPSEEAIKALDNEILNFRKSFI